MCHRSRRGGSLVSAIPPLTCSFSVGTAGFEPATSASRTLRAAKLRYVPKGQSLADVLFRSGSGFGGPALLLGGQERLDRAAEGAGVDRLDQHGVGGGAAGQEPVGLPVEQDQDRHVGEAAARLLEAEV